MYHECFATKATITGPHKVNQMFAIAYDAVKGSTGVELPALSSNAAKPGLALLPPAIVANISMGFFIFNT